MEKKPSDSNSMEKEESTNEKEEGTDTTAGDTVQEKPHLVDRSHNIRQSSEDECDVKSQNIAGDKIDDISPGGDVYPLTSVINSPDAVQNGTNYNLNSSLGNGFQFDKRFNLVILWLKTIGCFISYFALV